MRILPPANGSMMSVLWTMTIGSVRCLRGKRRRISHELKSYGRGERQENCECSRAHRQTDRFELAPIFPPKKSERMGAKARRKTHHVKGHTPWFYG